MEDVGEEVTEVLIGKCKSFYVISSLMYNKLFLSISSSLSDSSSNDSSSTLSGGDQTPALQTQYSREHVRNDGMQRRPKSPPRVMRGSSPPSNRVSSAPVAPPPPPPMMVPPPPMKTSPLDQLMAHKSMLPLHSYPFKVMNFSELY